MTPPNLQALFGARFHIGHDPAAQTAAERRDPWMQTLLCQNGLIYPHGANRLAVECKATTATRLAAMPGVIVHQRGGTEWTLVFDFGSFDAVAAIVKPKKRRFLSEKLKAASVKRLKGFRFTNATQPTARKTSKDASGASRVAR